MKRVPLMMRPAEYEFLTEIGTACGLKGKSVMSALLYAFSKLTPQQRIDVVMRNHRPHVAFDEPLSHSRNGFQEALINDE